MSVQEPANPPDQPGEASKPVASQASAPSKPGAPSRPDQQWRPAARLPGICPRALLSWTANALLALLVTGGFGAALIGIGLFVAPGVFIANGGIYLLADPAIVEPQPPRRAPIVPPSVPLGARRDWAFWTYVDKISQVWGRDWPLAIAWFEELDARYPGDPMVLDKLYACYIEDGRTLEREGDLAGARRRYQQAQAYDPTRPEAADFLADLDVLERSRQ